jgi:hypothetical protein
MDGQPFGNCLILRTLALVHRLICLKTAASPATHCIPACSRDPRRETLTQESAIVKTTHVVLLLALTNTAAMAEATLVRFEGAVGSQPFASVNGAVAVNDVNGVPPGGRPWLIRKFRATIRADGSIDAKGEGLVLGGGATIGTRGGVTQVAATLFCGAAQFSSPAVPISLAGDFVIKAKLLSSPPTLCTNPVLLIRNAPPPAGTPGAWFAAGIPDSDD